MILSRHLPRLLASAACIGVAALTLGGCQTMSSSDITGSTGRGGLLANAMTPAAPEDAARRDTDWQREAKVSGNRYNADPRNSGAAIRYAEALRHNGQRAQAVAVLQRAAIYSPNDRAVLGAYGRALADNGDLRQALDVLGKAHTPDKPDWRILNAQGAVLDQMGRYSDARRYYETALKIVPDESSVLSNLGLSYALSKNLPKAEETLRRAVAHDNGDKRVRQNLALVIGLQGRFKEAEDVARADLPPDQAASNIAYLRQMLAQQGRGAAPKKMAQTASAE
ncbi:MAG: tetratricopeptide repeat protein [Variibacter sp.]